MSDDEVYWSKASAGDGDAFGVIFDRHKARLHRHSRGLAPSFTDADDVVAVTFLEAWRKRDAVRFVDGSMLPWLLRTATFTAGNLTRATRRYRAALNRLPANDHHPDHADTVGHGDALTALRQLSILDQQVITLCVIEGLTTDESARVLGVRAGTVKSRLSRAKTRLRDQFEPRNVFRLEGATDVH